MAATLQAIARCAPAGSDAIFDYLIEAAFHARRAEPLLGTVVAAAAGVDEPMQCGLDPAALADDLRPGSRTSDRTT